MRDFLIIAGDDGGIQRASCTTHILSLYFGGWKSSIDVSKEPPFCIEFRLFFRFFFFWDAIPRIVFDGHIALEGVGSGKTTKNKPFLLGFPTENILFITNVKHFYI